VILPLGDIGEKSQKPTRETGGLKVFLKVNFYTAAGPPNPKVLPKPPNAIIASIIMKKKLLSIPQDGPAARSMKSRSKSRKPLLWQRPAKGDTAGPGRQPAAATPGLTAP